MRHIFAIFPDVFLTKTCFFFRQPDRLKSSLVTFQNVKNSLRRPPLMRPKMTFKTHTFNSRRKYPIGRKNLYALPLPLQRRSEGKPPTGSSPSGKGRQKPCKDYLKGNCTNPSCDSWHPPVCVKLQNTNKLQNQRKAFVSTPRSRAPAN